MTQERDIDWGAMYVQLQEQFEKERGEHALELDRKDAEIFALMVDLNECYAEIGEKLAA